MSNSVQPDTIKHKDVLRLKEIFRAALSPFVEDVKLEDIQVKESYEPFAPEVEGYGQRWIEITDVERHPNVLSEDTRTVVTLECDADEKTLIALRKAVELVSGQYIKREGDNITCFSSTASFLEAVQFEKGIPAEHRTQAPITRIKCYMQDALSPRNPAL